MYGSIIDFQRLLRGLCINTYHIYVLQERTAQKNPLLLFLIKVFLTCFSYTVSVNFTAFVSYCVSTLLLRIKQ